MNKTHERLREAVRELCANFPGEYWRKLDAKREYPEELVRAMTESGYLSALIPEEYGGMGLDLSAACAILEEVNKSGANANPAHAQMYTMGTVLRHGSEAQKKEYLPKIASGELRLQAFRHRARGGHRHYAAQDDRRAAWRPLRSQRAQDLHLPRLVLGPDGPPRPHHTAAGGHPESQDARQGARGDSEVVEEVYRTMISRFIVLEMDEQKEQCGL